MDKRYVETEGYWGFSEKVPALGSDGEHPTSVVNFRMEGEYLTMRLLSISPLAESPGDGFYKLRTKWEGDVLCWLPPHGDWEEFAVYQDGEFFMHSSNERHRFVKISPEKVASWNQDLKKDGREPYVYLER